MTIQRTVALNDLPTAMRSQTIADAGSDARHLEALLGCAVDKLVGLTLPDPALRGDLELAVSLIQVARDLAETLDWKLERLDRGPQLVG